MRKRIAYKDHLILGESFQRMEYGSWVAQYSLVRRETLGTRNDFPSHKYQFNAIFRTKNEADKYALRRAKERIDKN
jgi:hypothetical protein